MTVLLLYRLRKYRKHQREAKVRSYLKRYNPKDVRVRPTPPGGWNVTFKRNLYKHIQKYWSRELPSLDEAATIDFREIAPRKSTTPLFCIDLTSIIDLTSVIDPPSSSTLSSFTDDSNTASSASNETQTRSPLQSEGQESVCSSIEVVLIEQETKNADNSSNNSKEEDHNRNNDVEAQWICTLFSHQSRFTEATGSDPEHGSSDSTDHEDESLHTC